MQYKTLNITKFTQSGFLLQHGKKSIYIDPFQLPDNQPLADFIFVTHEHYDHLEEKSIRKIFVDTTLLYGNDLVRGSLPEDLSGKVNLLTPGAKLDFGSFSIEAVPAYNTNKFRETGLAFHPRENLGMGILFRFIEQDGSEIIFYDMGDTDMHAEVPTTLNVDVLAVPVSGTYVMTADEAIDAVQKINPKVVIPVHYDAGVGSVADAEKLKSGVTQETWIMESIR